MTPDAASAMTFGLPALRGLAALMAFACVARAQTPSTPPRVEDVIAVANLDFNNDAIMDRALLVRGEEDADLLIFLGDGAPDAPPGRMKPALVRKGFVFMGAMWGTTPSLAVNDRGSLIVTSRNDSIGRNRWEQTLTVVWRNGEFLVVGVTRAERDTLDLKAGGKCDINLSTGKGTRNGKAVSVAARPVRVADWSDDSLPRECRF